MGINELVTIDKLLLAACHLLNSVDANNFTAFIWVVSIVLTSSFIIALFVICFIAVDGS